MVADLKPEPNSMALTAGTEKTRWLKRDSKESKNGSPSPHGRLETFTSTIPPRDSPSSIASLRIDS